MSRKKLGDPTSWTWDSSSLLRAYYLAVFRPAARKRLHYKWVERYDASLRRFEKFVGGRPRLGAVTHELLSQFTKALRSRRCSEKNAKNLAGCIRTIVREWDGTAVPRVEFLPSAEPGTLRYYFEHTYKPEVMFNCSPLSVADTLRGIRKLRKFAGHDVLLSELDDGLIASFLKSLLAKGAPATSVNGERAVLLAVWNHAYDNRAVDRAPRVKKLKEVRNPPEAWGVAELKQLLSAARRFRSGHYYHGTIRCDRFWPALLLIAYDTALRRGSLMAIRCDDIDLANRLLRIDGGTMKTLKGQNFRLSEATIDAVREILEPPRELLFGTLHPHTQYRHFDLLIEAAGIRRHRRKGMAKFHALRRSTATLVAAAAGVGAASSLLGHSDAYVTGRYVDPTAVQLDVTKFLPSLAGA
jgi:integrase